MSPLKIDIQINTHEQQTAYFIKNLVILKIQVETKVTGRLDGQSLAY